MIKVFYGTESGNSEMAADDIVELIEDAGGAAEVIPMEDADVSELSGEKLIIVVTSTYGDGELPETTQPFYDALKSDRPDLSKVSFAAFGLGDSTYETYGNGIDTVSALLKELGASQTGETGRHDAAKTLPLTDVVSTWAQSTLPIFQD
ncbi:MAG: nitric oxide synthase [Ponticaulis sp.]|nr:nitric oxide synthase [Ponticaulis sp.]